LAATASHLLGIDAHRLFHQERVTLVEQMMSDLRHLPVAPQRHDEIGAGCGEHFSIIRVGRRVSNFGRSLFDDGEIGILDGDQFNVRHGH
jgi:hypothetical protein